MTVGSRQNRILRTLKTIVTLGPCLFGTLSACSGSGFKNFIGLGTSSSSKPVHSYSISDATVIGQSSNTENARLNREFLEASYHASYLDQNGEPVHFVVDGKEHQRVLILNGAHAQNTGSWLVIGQRSLETATSASGSSVSVDEKHHLYFPQNVSIIAPQNGRKFLAVTDYVTPGVNTYRVLIYESPERGGDFLKPRAIVSAIGAKQSDGTFQNVRTLRTPGASCNVGPTWYVPEIGGHQILSIDWNEALSQIDTLPATDSPAYESADIRITAPVIHTLGQPDFTTTVANNPAIQSWSNRLKGPTAVACLGRLAFIADEGNYRVLRAAVTQAGLVPGPVAFGQPDTTTAPSSTCNTTQSRSCKVTGLAVTSSHLFVVDGPHHRVLRVPILPTIALSADFVYGQSNFTSFVKNFSPSASGAVNPFGLNSPSSVSVFQDDLGGDQEVFIADENNQRLVHVNLPSAPPALASISADYGIGVTGLFDTTVNPTTLRSPTSFCKSDTTGRFYVLSQKEKRVLIYSHIPLKGENGEGAIGVLGQPSLTVNTIQDPMPAGYPAHFLMTRPEAVACAMGRVFVADSTLNRVLIYDENASLPIGVMGQADFDQVDPNPCLWPDTTHSIGNNAGCMAFGMDQPTQLTTADGWLYVTNNTVSNGWTLFLGWDLSQEILPVGQQSARAPDMIIPNFGSNIVSGTPVATSVALGHLQGGPTFLGVGLQSGSQGGFALSFIDQLFPFPSSPGTPRAFWTNFLEDPTSLSQPAAWACGASTFVPSPLHFCGDVTVRISNEGIFVTDPGNHRVLEFTIPGMTAMSGGSLQLSSLVNPHTIGQASPSSGAGENAGTYLSQNGLSSPADAQRVDSDKLIVADKENDRLLIFYDPVMVQ